MRVDNHSIIDSYFFGGNLKVMKLTALKKSYVTLKLL